MHGGLGPAGSWLLSEEQMATMAGPFAEAAGERVDRALGAFIEIAEVHPSEPHWYLGCLGTHPDWQRRGIASAVLAPVLGHCDADGLPAYLETQRESNVPFYRRHGFEVVGTKQLSNGGPNMWLMWRDVRPTTLSSPDPSTWLVFDLGAVGNRPDRALKSPISMGRRRRAGRERQEVMVAVTPVIWKLADADSATPLSDPAFAVRFTANPNDPGTMSEPSGQVN